MNTGFHFCLNVNFVLLDMQFNRDILYNEIIV